MTRTTTTTNTTTMMTTPVRFRRRCWTRRRSASRDFGRRPESAAGPPSRFPTSRISPSRDAPPPRRNAKTGTRNDTTAMVDARANARGGRAAYRERWGGCIGGRGGCIVEGEGRGSPRGRTRGPRPRAVVREDVHEDVRGGGSRARGGRDGGGGDAGGGATRARGRVGARGGVRRGAFGASRRRGVAGNLARRARLAGRSRANANGPYPLSPRGRGGGGGGPRGVAPFGERTRT